MLRAGSPSRCTLFSVVASPKPKLQPWCIGYLLHRCRLRTERSLPGVPSSFIWVPGISRISSAKVWCRVTWWWCLVTWWWCLVPCRWCGQLWSSCEDEVGFWQRTGQMSGHQAQVVRAWWRWARKYLRASGRAEGPQVVALCWWGMGNEGLRE